jgi:hypothetical protein
LYSENGSGSENLSLLGFGPDEFEEIAVDVWPENVAALNVFLSMWTQWRVGFSGPYGFDYTALPVVMDLTNIPTADRADTFESLRVMEREAVSLMNRKD